jgi:hypothetical protein
MSNYTSYTSSASIAGVHKNSEEVSSSLDYLDSVRQSHLLTTLKIITTTASIRRFKWLHSTYGGIRSSGITDLIESLILDIKKEIHGMKRETVY